MSKIIRRSVEQVAAVKVARASRDEADKFRAEKEQMRDERFVDNASPGRRPQVWQQFNVWGIDKSLLIQRDTRNRMLKLSQTRGKSGISFARIIVWHSMCNI